MTADLVKMRYLNQLWLRFVAYSITNLDILKQKQNCRHITDSIFKYICLNENFQISYKILLKYVPQGNWQLANIVSDNCIAPNRQQAIMWTHDDPLHWPI